MSEKKNHQNDSGKFIKIVSILAFMAILVGASISIFEFVVDVKGLVINEYESIFNIGSAFETLGIIYNTLFVIFITVFRNN